MEKNEQKVLEATNVVVAEETGMEEVAQPKKENKVVSWFKRHWKGVAVTAGAMTLAYLVGKNSNTPSEGNDNVVECEDYAIDDSEEQEPEEE